MFGARQPNAEPIPGYRLTEPIGSGGFGEVWKCEAPGGLFKAIKFVYGNLNSLDVEGVRAEQELNALQRVKEVRHPFVCSLDRIEVVNGELCIVMELAERTLHDLFVECQAAGLIGIPRDDLLRYLRDAAEALDYMNDKHNLQHLDVKPRNLFIIGDRVKVADFGLVKTLERASLSGLMGGVTPLYAPPETFSGKISATSDQYSLAIVYQELLTGQRPFVGKNARQLAQAHLQGEPDLRSLPEAERPIVARALSKEPEKRFGNCMAFLAALYRARTPLRAETLAPKEARLSGKIPRPKTMAETMEDVQLEAIEFSGRDRAVLEAVSPSPAPVAADPDDAANLGMTVPQPETGALRPTLIIGVGGFGRKALLELRCRFLDRFGDLRKLPLVRFLCIEPDPEAAQLAMRGAPEVALSRHEVYHLPLQPVGNYRRRSIDQLTEWLPREKLYAMPRSLQPQGSRALGRLAFADNQQRLVGRLRREIQEITNPDVAYQSVTQTGLALRDGTPRIYVIGAAGGGTSGLLADLGYALRRQLAHLRHPQAPVVSLLFCGAPTDPATPKTEQANIYATLTELNHFSDPGIPFAAEYGAEGQRIVDSGSPFSAVYLLPQSNRNPESLDEIVAHLGSYVFHELTTPLGLRLDHLRQGDDYSGSAPPTGVLPAPLRSFGTYAVWFPRGLLLRLAARHTCQRLIQGWLAAGDIQLNGPAAVGVQNFIQRLSAEASFQADALLNRLGDAAQDGTAGELGGRPAPALTAVLANLEEQSQQSVAHEDPGNWCRQAINRVLEWVGGGEEGPADLMEWRKTRVSRALFASAQKIADDWDQQISAGLFALMEHPGARIAAAEAALSRAQKLCHAAAEGLVERVAQHQERTAQAWQEVEAALQECLTTQGGFRWFGGRSRGRSLRAFMDSLAKFARQRLAEETVAAVRFIYISLKGRLADRARDLGFCRQRLRHLQESLDSPLIDTQDEAATHGPEFTLSHSPLPSTESYWEAIRQSATARVVLPDGQTDLEVAALRFLERVSADQWLEMDKELHERVLAPRGGLHGACVNSGDLTRMLTAPLMEEAANLLGQRLPIMDVAQVLGGEFGIAADAPAGPAPPAAASPPSPAPTPATAPAPAALSSASAPQAVGLKEQTKEHLDRAAPLIVGKKQERQHTFLLVPASPAGKALGEVIRQALPGVKIVRVPGQADLMFCREQGFLGAEDLPKLLQPCRAAYHALANAAPTSPHARFDITDWLPLEP